MTYDVLGPRALDYLPCQYGNSKLTFRGPLRDLTMPYVAFIGGTQTFGKFIEQPFPLKVEHLTGVASVNFGQMNAGLDVFNSESVIHEAAQNARVTVVEVLGAANMSSLFYTVHPRRNDRFLHAKDHLKRLYPEVDFTQFNFTQHMLQHLRYVDEARFEVVIHGLRRTWLRKMRHLLKRMGGKVILIWLGHPTHYKYDEGEATHCVTQSMVDELGGLVECCISVQAIPDKDVSGLVFNPMEEEAARHVLSPKTHTAAARALLPMIDRLL